MPLPTTGQIDLNAIHVEAGGITGTAATINDTDIRGLVGVSSGVAMDFADWYGASGSDTTTAFTSATNGGDGIGYKGFTGGSPSQSFGSSSNDEFDDQNSGSTRTMEALYTTTETSGKVTTQYVHLILDSSAGASSFSSIAITPPSGTGATWSASSSDITNNTATFSGKHYWRWEVGSGTSSGIAGSGSHTVTVS